MTPAVPVWRVVRLSLSPYPGGSSTAPPNESVNPGAETAAATCPPAPRAAAAAAGTRAGTSDGDDAGRHAYREHSHGDLGAFLAQQDISSKTRA